MTDSNLARARAMAEAWDENAEACRVDDKAAAAPSALHAPVLHKAAA
jgi:hypothetical protein